MPAAIMGFHLTNSTGPMNGAKKGAVKDYLAALDEAPSDPRCKTPKVISPSDPASAWTANVSKRVQFGYGLNYLIDNAHAIPRS